MVDLVDANALYRAWREAIKEDHPMSAKSYADALLDHIRFFDARKYEPEWKPSQKRNFLNWCEREGLFRGRS